MCCGEECQAADWKMIHRFQRGVLAGIHEAPQVTGRPSRLQLWNPGPLRDGDDGGIYVAGDTAGMVMEL